jgi:putative hydrolase of HD superfamily
MDKLVDLFFESLMLNRQKVSGPKLVGADVGSIAEHSFRATMIGYFLSKLENAEDEKVMKMLLFHDLREARISDINKVMSRYMDRKNAEKKAFSEQLEQMPKKVAQELRKLDLEMNEKKTKEAKIAKDADYLEMAITAKEQIEKGIDMNDWLNNIEKALKTKSAKELFQSIKEKSSNDWWKNLKYIPEIKRGKKRF